jgi:hypothetical protein
MTDLAMSWFPCLSGWQCRRVANAGYGESGNSNHEEHGKLADTSTVAEGRSIEFLESKLRAGGVIVSKFAS